MHMKTLFAGRAFAAAALVLCTSLSFATPAAAQDAMAGMAMSSVVPLADAGTAVTVGDLKISGAFSRAMLPGQPTGGGYLTIINSGVQADKLLGASSPAAGAVTLHAMTVDGKVMQMRPVPDGIEIPAGGTVTLDPNGLHLMFEKVTAPFKAGDSVPVTLTFAKAGKVELELKVGAIGAKGP
jgi:copper(I)-binding protein